MAVVLEITSASSAAKRDTGLVIAVMAVATLIAEDHLVPHAAVSTEIALARAHLDVVATSVREAVVTRVMIVVNPEMIVVILAMIAVNLAVISGMMTDARRLEIVATVTVIVPQLLALAAVAHQVLTTMETVTCALLALEARIVAVPCPQMAIRI